MRKKKIFVTEEVINNQINKVLTLINNFFPYMDKLIINIDNITLEQKIGIQTGKKLHIFYQSDDQKQYSIIAFIYIYNKNYIVDTNEELLLSIFINKFFLFFPQLDEDGQIFALSYIHESDFSEKERLRTLRKLKQFCKGKSLNKINSLILL
ncbi:MAG: hypothetical protein SR2Q5_06550, partial [Quinella sp. 2Q5]|nr:hypothetical protein [Quinella sp. 2Q5]